MYSSQSYAGLHIRVMPSSNVSCKKVIIDKQYCQMSRVQNLNSLNTLYTLVIIYCHVNTYVAIFKINLMEI